MGVSDPEFWRIYATDDGSSALERATIEMTKMANGALSSATFAAQSVRVVYQPPHHINSWHTGNRRQLVVTLAGESEIETGDGQVLVASTGVVEIIEDLDGKGHITHARGDQGRLVMYTPLAEPEAGTS